MNDLPSTHQAESPALVGTLLCIEDSLVVFEAVSACLAAHTGLTLLHETSGHDGVRRALAECPQVIILDMHLPDISGVEVLRLLSELISARQIRVILLTSDKLGIDVLKAMSLGAFVYLSKPADPAVLESTVRRALKRP